MPEVRKNHPSLLDGKFLRTMMRNNSHDIDQLTSIYALNLTANFSMRELTSAFELPADYATREEIYTRIAQYTKLKLLTGQFCLRHYFGAELLDTIVTVLVSKNGICCPLERTRFLKQQVRHFTAMLSSSNAITEAEQYFNFTSGGRKAFQDSLFRLLNTTISNICLAKAV